MPLPILYSSPITSYALSQAGIPSGVPSYMTSALKRNESTVSVTLCDMYPSGDTTGTTDTANIQALQAKGQTHVVWGPGQYYLNPITITNRTIWKGVPGYKNYVSNKPRLYLINNANTHLIHMTTTAHLLAYGMDFWGNRTGQTAGPSYCIYLDDDTSGVYTSANAVELYNCIVREGYSGCLYGGINRNVGVVQNKTLFLNSNGDGVTINGEDWIFDTGYEIGIHAGNCLVVNDSSNNFTDGDIYNAGLSGVVIGANVRTCQVSSNQINSNGMHGIDSSAVTESTQVAIQINQNTFYSNSRNTTNTYSDIVLSNPGANIDNNVFVPVIGTSSKTKNMISTPITFKGYIRVIGSCYNINSYATDFTRSRTQVGMIDTTRFIIAGTQSLIGISANMTPTVWIRSYVNTSTLESFKLYQDGSMQFGPGLSLACDTTISRRSVGTLAMAVGNAFSSGTTTTALRPAASVVGAGAQMYDTTLGIPIWSDGTNWKNSAGVVV